MQYLSFEFALAFLVLFALYWVLVNHPRWQKILLLLAGHAFYALFDWRFDLLLIVFSVVMLGLAQQIHQANERWRPWLYRTGILLAVLNLAVFKYYNFFREQLQLLMGGLDELPILDILLPVGISFYTFQGIAYLASIARKEREPACWIDGLLHFSFFPTLLAGPICRPKELLTQIEATAPRQLKSPERAFLLILLAIIKKVWIAAWLEQSWVKPAFTNPDAFHAIELIGSLMAYAWQIYFDFSGYTDVVTAIALLLGYELPQNFAQPYRSASLRDFWRRWHISLSSWIRDFVYIPLGGSRCSWTRAQFNTLLAMAISGLWHGAATTYILWGIWHGLGLIGQNVWDKITVKRFPLPRFIAQVLTFVFVCLGWLLFRADSMDTVTSFAIGFTHWQGAAHSNWLALYLALAIFFVLAVQAQALFALLQRWLEATPWWAKPVWLVLAAWLVLELAPAGMPGFIYFGF